MPTDPTQNSTPTNAEAPKPPDETPGLGGALILETKQTQAALTFRSRLESTDDPAERERILLRRKYLSYKCTEEEYGGKDIFIRFEPSDPDLIAARKEQQRPKLSLGLTFQLSPNYPEDVVLAKITDSDLGYHAYRVIECGVKKRSKDLVGKPQIRGLILWLDKNITGLIEIGTELKQMERDKAKTRFEESMAKERVPDPPPPAEKKTAETKSGIPIVPPGEWSKDQQARLELALRRSSATKDLKLKFEFISKSVGEKSPGECLARYRELRAKALAKQGVKVEVPKPEEESPPRKEEEGAIAKQENLGGDPEKRGFEVTLQQLQIMGLGIVKAMAVICVVRCSRCGDRQTKTLLADQGIKYMCGECHVSILLRFRPKLVHINSHIMGYLDLERCEIVDVLNINALLNCDNCFSDFIGKGFKRGKTTKNCRKCHRKMHVEFEGFIIEKLVARSGAIAADKVETFKGKKKTRQIFTVGQPLPDGGTCKHMKKSHRWFRYQCCGIAYPCEKCHDEKSDHKWEWANRHICGKCSKEQNVSQKICVKCGSTFVRKKTAFWEGGLGNRDRVLYHGMGNAHKKQRIRFDSIAHQGKRHGKNKGKDGAQAPPNTTKKKKKK